MKTIAIGKFKAQCLALINDITRTHENIIITKHGKPVAKVVPIGTTGTEPEKKPLKGARYTCLVLPGER